MPRVCIRLLVVVLLAGASVSLLAQEKAAPQTTPPAPMAAALILKDAMQKAALSKKTVWVEFGASWCGWCHKLDAFLHDPDVSKVIAANYVIVNLTVQESADKKALENPGAQTLMEQLGGADAGLPFFAYLDGRGRKVADSKSMPDGSNIGFPGNAKESEAFLKLLDKTALHFTEPARSKIVDYLAKNVPQ